MEGLRIDLGEARGVTTLMEHVPMLLLMFYSLFCMLMASHSTSLDTITLSRPLRGNETIVSAGGSFELGFFTNDDYYIYLGIWYKNQIEASTKTVVWVASREDPLILHETNSSVLRLTDQGILVLLGRQGNTTTTTIWSSNSSRSTTNPAVARLLESGNLVVKDAKDDDTNTHNFLWQSFDHPCDTLLPGMKLGKNKKTGLDRYLSSSSSSTGGFRYQLDPRGYAQLFLLMIDSRGEQMRSLRVGPWDGLGINWKRSVFRELLPDYNCESRFVYDEKRMSFSYGFFNCSDLTRIVLNGVGILECWVWKEYNWIPYSTAPMDSCDTYASCGAYSVCYLDTSSSSSSSSSSSYYNYATTKCRCLEGFVPKLVKDSGNSDWDWSEGCVRRRPLLDCNSKVVGRGDVFVKYSGLNLPDSQYSWFHKSMKLEECDTLCLKNCSCMAYANLDLSGGSGCLLLFGDLLDIRNSTLSDQDFYIRMAASKPDKTSVDPNKRETIEVSLLAASTGAIVLLGLLGMCFYISKKWQSKRQERKEHHHQQNEDVQLQLFDLATIAIATNNFSIDNKLGEGGFGPVYKGMLRDGQEIAVKRLSKTSKQGVDEFKNEVICIAKLQHRNLVQLLGCCIQGEEKMLIYEYMSNNSLDSFIFDQSRSISLDWPKCFHIINGVARGLLYLHQDSTLRVVHRDLKASNVLLDHDMNPKISDFGMAKIFGGNESKANTKRVVGTYGYISPEYAIEGLFSVKSDVFSFGVLVLEIVSGKRNRELYDRDHHLNLLGHAWRLHREGRSMELMNASIENSCNQSQVLRSIHVGLLCVQQRPEDRPYMSSVVLMLTRDGTLPQPKQPGFFFARNLLEPNRLSRNGTAPSSANELTITELEARY